MPLVRIDSLPGNFFPNGSLAAWHHAPVAVVSFVARPNRPILLLEEIGHLLDDVACVADARDANESLVEVTFTAATYNMVSRTLVALDIGDQANAPVPSNFSEEV